MPNATGEVATFLASPSLSAPPRRSTYRLVANQVASNCLSKSPSTRAWLFFTVPSRSSRLIVKPRSSEAFCINGCSSASSVAPAMRIVEPLRSESTLTLFVFSSSEPSDRFKPPSEQAATVKMPSTPMSARSTFRKVVGALSINILLYPSSVSGLGGPWYPRETPSMSCSRISKLGGSMESTKSVETSCPVFNCVWNSSIASGWLDR